jgi:hypothetical protein
MHWRVIWPAALVLCVTVGREAAGAPPPRYLPAPAGRFYYFFHAAGSGFGGEASVTETAPIPGKTGEHAFESVWERVGFELGLTVGHGLGRIGFLPRVDASLYVPVHFDAFRLTTFIQTDAPPGKQAENAWTTLHRSLQDPPSSRAFGDASLSVVSLLHESRATWLSGGLRLAMPTGASAPERFVRLLHGEETGPAPGAGVARLAPSVSLVQMLGGQRLFGSLEYAMPLGREAFAIETPDLEYAPTLRYADAARTYREEFSPGGIAQAVVGLETNLEVGGIVPGLEVTLRSFAPARWTENADPRAGTGQAIPYPNHPPRFLEAAAWHVAGLPLRSLTQLDLAAVFTKRFGESDVLRVTLGYASDSYSSSFGVRVGLVSLFVERPRSDRAAPGRPEALEIETAPVLEAPPPPPSGRIRTVVTATAPGAGVRAEEAAWTGGVLRSAMRALDGYDVLIEKAMEQLAYEPCGDAACGARFGRALRVQASLVSRLDRVPGGYLLVVQMIDPETGSVAASDSVTVPVLEDVRAQAPELLARLTRRPPASVPAR